jgi:MFS family permease
MGLGSLTAALLVASLDRPRPTIIVVGAFGLGAMEIVLGGVTSYPVALVAMFGAGFGAIAMMVSANTSIQLAVPDRLRGRVLSVYTTVFAGSTPIGAPIIGWLASAFGTQVALVVGGGIALVAALVAGAWVARGGLSSAGSPGGAGRRRQGGIGQGQGTR